MSRLSRIIQAMKPTIVSEKDGATRFGSEFVTNTEGNDYGEKAGK